MRRAFVAGYRPNAMGELYGKARNVAARSASGGAPLPNGFSRTIEGCAAVAAAIGHRGWHAFSLAMSRKMPDAAYRFKMRDDDVNHLPENGRHAT
jgi:hypothetical protein